MSLKCCSTASSTSGKAFNAFAYGPLANTLTSSMNFGRSGGTGDNVTFLWNHASAAYVGRMPIGLPVCE